MSDSFVMQQYFNNDIFGEDFLTFKDVHASTLLFPLFKDQFRLWIQRWKLMFLFFFCFHYSIHGCIGNKKKDQFIDYLNNC